MKVRYVGPFAAVDMVVAGRDVTVANGEIIEVDSEMGLSLCEQTDNWQPSGKAAKDEVAAAQPEDTAAEESAPVEQESAA